jgi:glycogen operon protein
MRLAGEAIDEREAEGGRISDETLLVLLNAYHEALEFTLPEAGGAEECQWELVMDTEQSAPPAPSGDLRRVGSKYALESRTVALFRRVSPPTS